VEFQLPFFRRKWNILAFRGLVLNYLGLRPTCLTDLFSPAGVSHIPFARLQVNFHISKHKSEYPLFFRLVKDNKRKASLNFSCIYYFLSNENQQDGIYNRCRNILRFPQAAGEPPRATHYGA